MKSSIPAHVLVLAFLHFAAPHFMVGGIVAQMFEHISKVAQLAAFVGVTAVSFVPLVRWPVVFVVICQVTPWGKALVATGLLLVGFAVLKIWQMNHLKKMQSH